MILNCPDCSASYIVPASTFAMGPRNVRCAKCGNVWVGDLPATTSVFAWPDAQIVTSAPPESNPAKIVANETDLSDLSESEKSALSAVPPAPTYKKFEDIISDLTASMKATDFFKVSEQPAASPSHASPSHEDSAPPHENPLFSDSQSVADTLREIRRQINGMSMDDALPSPSHDAPITSTEHIMRAASTTTNFIPSPANEKPRLIVPELNTLVIAKKNKKAPRVRLPVLWKEPKLVRFRRSLGIMALAAFFIAGISWTIQWGPLKNADFTRLIMGDWTATEDTLTAQPTHTENLSPKASTRLATYLKDELTLPSLSDLTQELKKLKLPDIEATAIKADREKKKVINYQKQLGFQNVKSERRYEDNEMKLIVEGEIINKETTTLELPPIKITALDATGTMLDTWTIDPPQPSIDAQGKVSFSSTTTAPIGSVTEVNLRFAPQSSVKKEPPSEKVEKEKTELLLDSPDDSAPPPSSSSIP